MLSVTLSVCYVYFENLGLIPRSSAAAPVVNPTTPTCHHSQDKIRVGGLCPAVIGMKVNINCMLPHFSGTQVELKAGER